MKSAAVYILMALLGGMGPQKAPPPKIQWVPTLDEALKVAKDRNAVVLLSFSIDGERRATVQRRATFGSPVFIKMARQEILCVIAHRGVKKGEEHKPEEMRDPRSGAVVYRCPLYEGVTCEQHRTIYGPLRGRYRFKEPPATFLLDPNGEVLIGAEGFPLQAFHALKKVKEAQSKLGGRSVTAGQYRKIQKEFDKAEAKLVEEKYYLAIADFKRLVKKKRLTEPIRARAVKALEDINEIGLQLLEKGRKLHENDPVKGMKLIKKVRHEFKGTEAGEKAKQVVRELEGGEK